MSGADNVTLDLNGHTVDGDGNLQDACPGDQPSVVGIDNGAGHTRSRSVAVRSGLHHVGDDQNDVQGLSVARSSFAGIVVVNSSGTRVTPCSATQRPGLA